MCGLGGLIATPLMRRGPYPARPSGLHVLDEGAAHVLGGVVAVFLGTDEDPLPVIRRVDATLAALDPSLRKGLLAIFPFLEGSGFLLGASLAPFSELPTDAQARVLRRWSESHVLVCRQAVASLRDLVLVHRFGGGDG